ncbi:MAG: hypothetical protein V2A66_05535 [Pseudomonadota bacterium]
MKPVIRIVVILLLSIPPMLIIDHDASGQLTTRVCAEEATRQVDCYASITDMEKKSCPGSKNQVCRNNAWVYAEGESNIGGNCNYSATDRGSCDTGSVCSTGQCEAGHCYSRPVSCDDGNACTTDTCVPGSPTDGTSLFTCKHDAVIGGVSCTPTDNPCAAAGQCQGGACATTQSKLCLSLDQCQTAACNRATGECASTPKENNTPCNDGNACTRDESCQNGTCAGGVALDCPTRTECQLPGTCDPTTGCSSPQNKPLGEFCTDDGDPCTDDICSGTGYCINQRNSTCECTPGTTLACSSPDGCYGTQMCNYLGKLGPCEVDVGGPCTLADTCMEPRSGSCRPDGTCAGGTPINCGTPSDNCHEAKCVSGNCASIPLSGTWCDDSDACTAPDTCRDGTCTGAPMTCPDDNNPCTQPGRCVPAAMTLTARAAAPSTCVYDPVPGSDGKQNACGGCGLLSGAEGDICYPVTGISTTAIAADPCTTNALQCKDGALACVAKPQADGTACTESDGIFCTVAKCSAGACRQDYDTKTGCVCQPGTTQTTGTEPCLGMQTCDRDGTWGPVLHSATDGKACAETDGILCTVAKCQTGECNQKYETKAGCECQPGATKTSGIDPCLGMQTCGTDGKWGPILYTSTDGAACTDSDGKFCSAAKCQSGECKQDYDTRAGCVCQPGAAKTSDTEPCLGMQTCGSDGTWGPILHSATDGKTCTETDSDFCTVAKCQTGGCYQKYETKAGCVCQPGTTNTSGIDPCLGTQTCDAYGKWGPVVYSSTDGTACTDDDGNFCTAAKCQTGECKQDYDTKAGCECQPRETKTTGAEPCLGTQTCGTDGKWGPILYSTTDGRSCTDSDSNFCTVAKCSSGECRQDYETKAGCECQPLETKTTGTGPCLGTQTCSAEGKWGSILYSSTDGAACTDSDGNFCTSAKCSAGACRQDYETKAGCECQPRETRTKGTEPCLGTQTCNADGKWGSILYSSTDGRSCIDSDGDICTVARCSSGACRQDYETKEGCVCQPGAAKTTGSGPCLGTQACGTDSKWGPIQYGSTDGTACTDSDGKFCTEAKCSAGACRQDYVITAGCECQPRETRITGTEPCLGTQTCGTDGRWGPILHSSTDGKICIDSDGDVCTVAKCSSGSCKQDNETKPGCVCQPGATTTTGTGPCLGTQTCSADGKWGSILHSSTDGKTCTDSDGNFCTVAKCASGTCRQDSETKDGCVCQPDETRVTGTAPCLSTQTCSADGKWATTRAAAKDCVAPIIPATLPESQPPDVMKTEFVPLSPIVQSYCDGCSDAIAAKNKTVHDKLGIDPIAECETSRMIYVVAFPTGNAADANAADAGKAASFAGANPGWMLSQESGRILKNGKDSTWTGISESTILLQNLSSAQGASGKSMSLTGLTDGQVEGDPAGRLTLNGVVTHDFTSMPIETKSLSIPLAGKNADIALMPALSEGQTAQQTSWHIHTVSIVFPCAETMGDQDSAHFIENLTYDADGLVSMILTSPELIDTEAARVWTPIDTYRFTIAEEGATKDNPYTAATLRANVEPSGSFAQGGGGKGCSIVMDNQELAAGALSLAFMSFFIGITTCALSLTRIRSNRRK